MKIKTLIINYIDSSGSISSRSISDATLVEGHHIDAFCQLRQERRSFNIFNITSAMIPDTGEIIENIAAYFELKGIYSEIFPIIQATQALKYFSCTSRGFRKREREILVDFALTTSEIDISRRDEIVGWINKLHEGDAEHYKQNLNRIPMKFRPLCRSVAWMIAKGSGRRPMGEKMKARFESEFPLSGCGIPVELPVLLYDDEFV